MDRDKEPLVAVPLAWLKPTIQDHAVCAEVDRLEERADVFNNFIHDLMERMERVEKAIAAGMALKAGQ